MAVSAVLDKMLQEKAEHNELELLLVGDSNWNYYKDKCSDVVYAIPSKNSGGSNCIFGNTRYFKNFLLRELKRHDLLETKITAKGYSLIPEYKIQ